MRIEEDKMGGRKIEEKRGGKQREETTGRQR